MRQKSDLVVGLDFGGYSLKCVEVSQKSGKINLHRVLVLPCPVDSAHNAAPALKDFFQDSSSLKHVRIAIAGPSLLIRRIALPAMTAAELRGAIRFEAERHIPFPVEECVIDFQILDQAANKKSMNVLLVAAKRDFVLHRLKMLEGLGIHPEIIDADIFCLMNAYEVLNTSPEQKTYGLLNIGHHVSSFAVVRQNLPFFVREIPFGGRDVTHAAAELKSMPEEQADPFKSDRSEQAREDLLAATQKGFEKLVEELRHSIDYFENESSEELKSIWLSGGGALSLGAEEVLSEALGRAVQLWDNTRKIDLLGNVDVKFLKDRSAELNVALGMVLRGYGSK